MSNNIGIRKYKEDLEVSIPFISGYAIVLPSAQEAKIEIPFFDLQGSRITAVFNYIGGSPVWVSNGGTAVPPTENSFSPVNCQPNPTQRDIEGGDILSFYNASSSNVTCCLYLYGYPYGF